MYHYFITRTQDGTMDKGYSKAAIYYISIGLFASFFFFFYLGTKERPRYSPELSFLGPLKSDTSSWLPMKLCRVGLEYVMD